MNIPEEVAPAKLVQLKKKQKVAIPGMAIFMVSIVIVGILAIGSFVRYDNLSSEFDRSEKIRMTTERDETIQRECTDTEALYEKDIAHTVAENKRIGDGKLDRFTLEEAYKEKNTARDDWAIAKRLGLEKDTAEKQCKEAMDQMNATSNNEWEYVKSHFFGG